MSAKYLLPCSCGLEVAVEPAQAGGTVQCGCGKQLDVPTLREIVRLKPVAVSGPAAPSSPTWGLRHGLLVLGTLLIVGSLATAAHFYVHRPQPLRLEYLSVGQVWQIWEELRQGVDRPPFPDQQMYALHMRSLYIALSGLALVAVVGILCLLAAMVVGRRHSLRSTNTASSVAPSTDTGSSNR